VSGPSESITAGSTQKGNHPTDEIDEDTNSLQIETTTIMSAEDATNNSTSIGATKTTSSMAEMTITTSTTTTTTTTQVTHIIRNCDKY
jgi:hypothetical protein